MVRSIVRQARPFMSLPEFFFERVTADIRERMDGVLALTEQLVRQRSRLNRLGIPLEYERSG